MCNKGKKGSHQRCKLDLRDIARLAQQPPSVAQSEARLRGNDVTNFPNDMIYCQYYN